MIVALHMIARMSQKTWRIGPRFWNKREKICIAK